MKRVVEAQDGQKVEMRPGGQVGSKHQWGGRRHGLERDGGKAPKVSIILSTKEFERLEKLRNVLQRNGSVTNGTKGFLGSTDQPGARLVGDSTVKRPDGRMSRSDACRVAVRLLWEWAQREGMVSED